MTGLTNLNLENCGISGAKENAAVRGALRELTGLTGLNLTGSGIQVGGATGMAEVLERATGLKMLHLSGNKLGGSEVVAVAAALHGMKGLALLDLGWNKVGADGAEALAGGLVGMAGLTVLRLQGNGIGNEGAVALAGALLEMTGLADLDVRDNRITGEGAQALAEGLANVTGFLLLDLSRNTLDQVGMEELALLAMEGVDVAVDDNLGFKEIKERKKIEASKDGVTHRLEIHEPDPGSLLGEIFVGNHVLMRPSPLHMPGTLFLFHKTLLNKMENVSSNELKLYIEFCGGSTKFLPSCWLVGPRCIMNIT
jgi:hypothetical protein